MELQAEGLSDVGMKRENNEDHILIQQDFGLFAVCDGLGGHASGEVASEMAAMAAAEYLTEQLGPDEPNLDRPIKPSRLLQVVEGAVQHACQKVQLAALEDKGLRGMGTTLTLLLVRNNKGIVAHVGDTRLYLRRESELHQLTSDHTLAQDLIEAGVLEADYEGPNHNVLTRAVGLQQSVKVDTFVIDLAPGDTYLLSSDGLTHHVDDTCLSSALDASPLDEIAPNLIAQANENGGSDNITAVVVRVLGEDKATSKTSWRLALEALRSVELFAKLPLRSLNRIHSSLTIHTIEAGETLIPDRGSCPGMYIVLDGSLQVTFKGRKVATLSPTETLGELSLARSRDAAASVEARTETRVALLTREEFRLLTRRYPRLGNRILRRLVSKLSTDLDQEWSADDFSVRAGWF